MTPGRLSDGGVPLDRIRALSYVLVLEGLDSNTPPAPIDGVDLPMNTELEAAYLAVLAQLTISGPKALMRRVEVAADELGIEERPWTS